MRNENHAVAEAFKNYDQRQEGSGTGDGDAHKENGIDDAPAFSDEALALRFSAQHVDRLRYVAAWGRWLIREPAVWRFDETMMSFSMARAVCKQAAAECRARKVAVAVASAKTVAAVERLAKADRRHAATADQWDAQPWLLEYARRRGRSPLR